MKKVTLFFLVLSIFSSVFAMTDRYSIAQYERLDGLQGFSRPLFGAKIFNSESEYASWFMSRSKMAASGIDYKDSSLLVAYLGKSNPDECIKITRIDETHKYFVLYAEPVKCSQEWAHPYIYFKLKKTAKIAKIIMK